MRPRLLLLLAALAYAGCALPARVREVYDADRARCASLRGEAASPLHLAFFGSARVDGASYAAFLDRRIRGVRGEGALWASCRGALACTDRDGVLRLSERYADTGIPQLIRISMLVHEARHAEGWAHGACPPAAPAATPFQKTDLRGKPECDATELGAQGAQYVWLSNIARHCSSCTPEERKQALEHSGFVLSLISDPAARERLARDGAAGPPLPQAP